MFNAAVTALLIGAHASSALAQDSAPQKVFRYAQEEAETGLDPIQVTDLYTLNLLANVFDPPLRFAYLAKPGTLEPNTLAELPTSSADYTTWTFKVRPGIYFTDDPAFKGKPRELTAADYVYSFKRNYDPRWKSPNYGSWEQYDLIGMKALRDEALKTGTFDYDREVEGIQVIDRYTWRMRSSKPQPRFPGDFTDPRNGALAREVVEANRDDIVLHPVGTGPFKLAEWRRSSFMAFNRNPQYREDVFHVEPDTTDPDAVRLAGALDGKRLPLVDRVEVSVINESQPRWLAFLNGEQDYLERMPFDLAPLAYPNGRPAPALAKRGVTVQRRPIIDVTVVLYNMENPTVGGYTPEKIALRRALNLALDRPELIRSEFKGQAMPAQSIVMPGSFAYDPQLRTELGQFDPEKANALLDAYGYLDRNGDGWREMPDGSPLVLQLLTRPDQRARIEDEIWKKSLDRIHVRVEFKVGPFPELLRKARSGQYMVWMLGLSASGPDPGGSFLRGFGPAVGDENFSRFRNAAYDRLYEEQDRLPDGPERIEKIRGLQKIMAAYAPMNFPLHRFALYMWYPWIEHFRSWPFLQDWWKYVDIDADARRKAGK